MRADKFIKKIFKEQYCVLFPKIESPTLKGDQQSLVCILLVELESENGDEKDFDSFQVIPVNNATMDEWDDVGDGYCPKEYIKSYTGRDAIHWAKTFYHYSNKGAIYWNQYLCDEWNHMYSEQGMDYLHKTRDLMKKAWSNKEAA